VLFLFEIQICVLGEKLGVLCVKRAFKNLANLASWRLFLLGVLGGSLLPTMAHLVYS
jgi:hypothetical protein